jgi:hypothetical protein
MKWLIICYKKQCVICAATIDYREAYKQSTNPLYGEPRHVVITETILIREVLWLVINLEITCTQKRTNQITG